jgi:hypothetical protein
MNDIKDIEKSMCKHIDELDEAVQILNNLIHQKITKENINDRI